MEVVLAEDTHIAEIVELWKELTDLHSGMDSFFSRSEDGHLLFEEQLRELIDSGDSQVWVALAEGAVVAFCVSEIRERPPVFEHARYGLISSMAVRFDYRRKGIGQQILTKACAWFESRNIDRIEVRVVAANEIAYSFWKKHGFDDYVHVLRLDKRQLPTSMDTLQRNAGIDH